MANQIELIIKSQAGDEKAKEQLVNENIPLVWSIVHRYNSNYIDKEELFQIGCVGLVKAINKFDVSYNVAFSTYAVPIILGEIKRFYRDDGLIKVSRSIKELNIKILKLKEEYYQMYQKEISIGELAKKLNVLKEDIILAMGSNNYPTSLSEIIYEGDSNDITLDDKLEDKQRYSLIDKITLKEEIAKLPSKEKEFLYLRYYLDLNQQEIAKRYNVSQVQVSRMEKKIIEKLKKQFL